MIGVDVGVGNPIAAAAKVAENNKKMEAEKVPIILNPDVGKAEHTDLHKDEGVNVAWGTPAALTVVAAKSDKDLKDKNAPVIVSPGAEEGAKSTTADDSLGNAN